MYSELTLQDVSFLMLYGGASVLAVLAAQLSVVGMTVVGIVRHDWFLGYGVSHYCQLAIIAAFIAYYAVALRQYSRWLLDNYADLEHKQVWQSLVLAIGLLVLYEVYTSNGGETYREYLAQVLTIAVIGFFLWRVETLQKLDATIGQPEPQREYYDYLGTPLAEQSGFRSYNTFSAAFKQLRGVSVTAWMKREGDRKGKAGL